jgi:hypothetical protein
MLAWALWMAETYSFSGVRERSPNWPHSTHTSALRRSVRYGYRIPSVRIPGSTGASACSGSTIGGISESVL